MASIVRAGSDPTNATSVDFTVTFLESVAGVGTGDFIIDQSGVTGASVTGISGSGTTYTVTVNSGSNDGTLSIDFDADAAGGVTDTAGIVSTADFTAGAAYTIDKTVPTVTSIARSGGNPTSAASVDFTVTISESVSGVGTGDFSIVQAGGVSGASITGVSGSGTTYTVSVNTGSGSGTLGLNLVDDDTIVDVATNALGGTGTGNGNFTGDVYTIDRTLPSVTSINRTDGNPTNAASVDFTVVFSESVSLVDATDFALAVSGLTGTSITNVTGSGTTYTVTVGTGSGDGTLGLNLVDDDSIIDTSSNPLGGIGTGNGNFTGQVYTVDKTLPTVSSIVRANVNPTNAASVDFTVTFSESVTGVGTADFVIDQSGVTGASVTGISGSGTTYTLTVGTGSNDGTLSIDFDADADGGATDGVGNVSTADFTTGEAYTIDKTLPTVASIVRAGANPTNAGSVDFTVTFSESVTGVGTGDFVVDQSGVTGASVTGISGSGTTYTVTVGTGSNDGTLSIDFDADADGGVTDTATNVSTADFTIGAAYTIDKTLPTVASIVSANSNPTNAASVDFTVTFSESVTGVGTGDFVVDQTGVTGASVTGISGSGTTYTVTVGTGSNSGTLSIDFDADANGGATDGVGNVTTADFTTGEAYTIDKTLPTVASIIRVDANPTNAASVNFTVTFSESVTGVGTGDFVVDQSGVTGASVTGISGSGATYTLTVATGSNDGTLSIDFDADADGGATDGVGIVSTADFTTGEDYTIDKTLPSVASIVRADANPTNAASVDFTVTFSEAVTGAGTGDFVVDQSGVTGASVTGISGSGTTYTVTVNTGSNDGTLSIDFDADADGGVTDTATNVSTADFTVGASYTIDKTLPTVVSIVRADASPTNSASVNFTVTFSESVTGVGTGDFVIDQSGVTGASVTGVSGSGTTYTVTVNSGSNDGTLSIDFDADATGGASDTAGNVTTADFTVGETYTIDKTIPTADIVDVTPDPRYALVGTVTINFSENVSGFVLGDLSLTRDNGAVNIGGLTLATVTAQQYTIDLSSVTNQNGADLLTLTAGANIQDNAGNSLAIDATDAFAIDINDPPAFTSTATPSVAENSTVVITVAVNDPDLPAQTITFTKVGGADAALFAINSSSGALTFITAPI